MLQNTALFQEKYNELNLEQRQAVDTIDGPVMVIAGPGTGKTQILALRICNILLQTDTQPHNILCLTFTDQGAVEMRNRLLKFMGPDAYKVHVYTYHAFAKKVIQENPDYFQNYDLEPLSDLERIEIIKQIIDELPYDNPLYSAKEGSRYYNLNPLNSLYGAMKKEGWTSAYLLEQIEKHRQYLRDEAPEVRYQRKYKEFQKGDINPRKLKEALEKFEKSEAAVKTFDTYQLKLAERNRFDYADMIAWTIDALQNNEDIRLDYQEQYLYLLADEFQDSSDAQIDILNLLTHQVEQPNLFVVGDDDQSIYRFQGANMENLVKFNTYYEPTKIVLLHNYRSSELIVEASKSLIDSNRSRLTTRLQLDKDFKASGEHRQVAIEPRILQFDNVIEEETYLYTEIKRAYEADEDLSEIAVLFVKHNIAAELIKVLTKQNIPVQVKRKVNLLEIPYILNILNILDLINSLHKGDYDIDHLIPALLNMPNRVVDFTTVYNVGKYLAQVNAQNRDKQKEDKNWVSWLDVLMGGNNVLDAELRDNASVQELRAILGTWVQSLSDKTLQMTFQMVLEQGGYLDNALSAKDNNWKLELLNTLFDYIKDEAAKKPDYTIDMLLKDLRLMEENGVRLDYLDIIGDKNGVNFVTCHGSKGMQFDKVYIMGGTEKNWKGRNRGGIALPPMETNTDSTEIDNDEEERRRLFYVAMTRTRKELVMTCAKFNTESSNKENNRALYLVELESRANVKLEQSKIPVADVVNYQSIRMELPKLTGDYWIDTNLIEERLSNYVMNVTHANKYIKCPITFYFEVILRVPSARTASMGYGNAVHQALERALKYQESIPNESIKLDKLKQMYGEAMAKFRSHFTSTEFDDFIKHGEEMLDKYYAAYCKEWLAPQKMYFEQTIDNVVINGVPFKGNVDRIDEFDDHYIVYDYKTGKMNYAKVKMPDPEKGGGDQWRQIVTYNLLIKASAELNKPMAKGILDFTEGDPLKRKVIEPQVSDMLFVENEIKQTYDAINQHKFEEGCGEDNCRWCQLVQSLG